MYSLGFIFKLSVLNSLIIFKPLSLLCFSFEQFFLSDAIRINSGIRQTPRVFHVETTWRRTFPRLLTVEYTWCVCEVSDYCKILAKSWFDYVRLIDFDVHKLINSFSTNVPLLYPLKTSGNLWFFMFSGGIEVEH